ncbi:hypothetical protein Syun_011844 [Stephania yunnanensis]|uniref:Myb/SANT-like domain-containing protein n=1 Tax=Stephania yunnanensis TaxID=152371 RepID=A0AAP0JZ25_9MAGN
MELYTANRYQGYVELMRCNSGFGWDPITKKLMASDEVWEEYFKSHPNQRHYQTDTFTNYDDLRIIVGNATASGRYSIGLGDDTDARTFEAEETSGDVLEDLTYDYDAEAFVQRNEHQQKNLIQPPTVGIFNAPPTIEMNIMVLMRLESLIIVDTFLGGFVILAKIIILGELTAWIFEGLPLKPMNLYYLSTNHFWKTRSRRLHDTRVDTHIEVNTVHTPSHVHMKFRMTAHLVMYHS